MEAKLARVFGIYSTMKAAVSTMRRELVTFGHVGRCERKNKSISRDMLAEGITVYEAAEGPLRTAGGHQGQVHGAAGTDQRQWRLNAPDRTPE